MQSARAFALIAVLSAFDTAAMASETSRTFKVGQPAIGLPLTVIRNGKIERVRLDLPEIAESIELGAGRQVRFVANHGIAATLVTASQEIAVTVDLDDAEAVAEPSARVEIVRAMRVISGGETLATFEIQSDIGLLGLADTPAHATVRTALARPIGALTGPFAGAEVKRIGPIATPTFPLELIGPRTHVARVEESPAMGLVAARP